jgi:hypothetical protein
VYGETVLDLVENGLFLRVSYESDGESLSAKTTSSADSMKVTVRTIRHVKVKYNINFGNVDTSAEDVSSNHDSTRTLVELTKLSNPLMLFHSSMYSNSWNSLFI